jgi:hypothetical protein
MKPRFWISGVLKLIGDVLAGYQSGHSDGVRKTRIETQQFLGEFARPRDLETYLQQRGEPQRTLELTAYEPGAPGVHSHGPSGLAGVACVAVGIFGLLPLLRRRNENSV